MTPHVGPFVTPQPWRANLRHDLYGTPDTYRLAARWLSGCRTVEDWGGAGGVFSRFLPDSVAYRCIDGTVQCSDQVLADLSTYRSAPDGILLRHVVDMTEDWAAVLDNALASYRRRMVVVTFTPDAPATTVAKVKTGWPVRHFNPNDLIDAMGAHLVTSRAVLTSHPERIYYLERAS
jgi:hypothetical protein